uniref:Uncharacterized protein n=1 Tax=Arundo donax TaxID=35708 RepID=A0A0A9CJH3_ARUDO
MSVIDTLTRVDAICQMYDRYDAGRLNGANVAGEDPFARLYASVDAEINQCLEVQTPPLFATQVCPYDPMIRSARSLGSACCRNVEIRRAKAKLLESDLPNLQRLALKKVALTAHPCCVSVFVPDIVMSGD